MKTAALLASLVVPWASSCKRAEASDTSDAKAPPATQAPAPAPSSPKSLVLIGRDAAPLIKTVATNACPGEPKRARGCGVPSPDLRPCRDGKGQCLDPEGNGYRIHLEVPPARAKLRTWASACWELVPKDVSDFNELEIDIGNVTIPGDVHFKLEKFAMGSGGEVFSSIRAAGKIVLDTANFRSPKGASALSGPERFCVVALPRPGDPNPRVVEFTIEQVAFRSNPNPANGELVLVGDRGRVVDYGQSECDPCRDKRGRGPCTASSSAGLVPVDAGAWKLDLIAQPRRKGQRSWAGGCWELNPIVAADAARLHELVLEVGPVAVPGEVLFKLEAKGPAARGPAIVCPASQHLPGGEALAWVGAPEGDEPTRTVVLDLANFRANGPVNVARLCAVSAPPEDGASAETRTTLDIRRAVFRKRSPNTPGKNRVTLIGDGGRVKSYSFSRSRGATASVTRNEDQWDLAIETPVGSGSYSGVCWDLNPLAVDPAVFKDLVIDVRHVARPYDVHIKMERPNWRQQKSGLMLLRVAKRGEVRLSLSGFKRALERLGRFCVMSLPSSGSSHSAEFSLGEVYLSD